MLLVMYVGWKEFAAQADKSDLILKKAQHTQLRLGQSVSFHFAQDLCRALRGCSKAFVSAATWPQDSPFCLFYVHVFGLVICSTAVYLAPCRHHLRER